MLSMLLLPSNRGVSNLFVRNSDLSNFSVATRVVRNLSVARKYASKSNMTTTASGKRIGNEYSLFKHPK